MVPLYLFANRVFSVANVAGLIAGFATFSTLFFAVQYFQDVLGYTVLQSGLSTLPITVGIFFAAPLSGQLVARIGPRLPIVVGALCIGVALFLLTSIEPFTSYADLWWKLVILGIGFGLTMSALVAAVLSATPPARAGLGSSMINTSRQFGISLGVAVLGAFVLQQFSGNIVSQLVQRGVPEPIAITIANKLASVGARASQIHLPGSLPLSQTMLHQAINQAFVDAVHGTFLISGITMLVSALLVAFLLPLKRRSTSASVEPTDIPMVAVVSTVPDENR
jgi:DHA2 family methylenomycin A resistance protein-like MFS transporter